MPLAQNMDLSLKTMPVSPLEPKNVRIGPKIGQNPEDWQPCWLKLATL